MTNLQIIYLTIYTYFGGLYPQTESRALECAQHVVEISNKENVDPILVATIIQRESGWRINARGAIGEIGLMQINVKNKHRYKLPKANIEKGIKIFKSKLKQCKNNVVYALEAYISGRCAESWRAKKRYRIYKKFSKMRK